MKSVKNNYFHVDWILIDELAIGPAPINTKHIKELQDQNIQSILSLCSKSEVQTPDEMENIFRCKRIVLPDHKSNRFLNIKELEFALEELKKLKQYGSVFVHCVAAVERSPIVCLGWLVKNHSLKPSQALDYLMQVHSGTSPLPEQLSLLDKL